MLTVLLHSGVGEIAAVVTRYYGGTKLGTGGLVKAYGGTVQLALGDLPLVERVDYVGVSISIAYPSITALQQAIVELGAEVVKEEYGIDVRYRLKVPRSRVDDLALIVANATRGDGRFSLE